MTSPTTASSSSPRASVACLVCRARKVKCDRALPECQNCGRLGIQCPRYHREGTISRHQLKSATEDIFKASGVEKRKVGSCEECRATKHRCTKTRPSCRRCILRKIECVYPGKQPDGDQSTEQDSAHEPLESSPGGGASGSWPEFGFDIEKLCSDTLPDDSALRLRLINAFFNRSHPLRCLNFIHKPSFMRSFDQASVVQDYGEPLLYVMSALGARHLYLDGIASDESRALPKGRVPGSSWAERARREVLANIHAPTVNHLMSMVLFCDYGLRADQHASVYLLISFLYRLIRLLGLDNPEPLERPQDARKSLQREIENRLVWSCYFIDIMASSGVDKNTSWREFLPNIPLPSPEDDFLLSHIPSFQPYVPQIEESSSLTGVQNLDLSALMIIVVRLRFRVLHLIRRHRIDGRIWDPDSPFLQTIERIDTLHQQLPERYKLSDLNIYVLKDRQNLGAVFFLHFLIHTVAFDLMRLSLAGYSFPLAALFKDADVPAEFRSHCQERARYHAMQVSALIRKGMACGRISFDDLFCADASLESAKIQIIYAATVDGTAQAMETARVNLRTNLELLDRLHRGKDEPNQYITTLLPFCKLFGFNDIAEEYKDSQSALNDQAEVTGSAAIDHLSRFATFRMAKSEVKGAKSAEDSQTLSGGDAKSPLTQAVEPPQPPMASSSQNYALPTLRPNFNPAFANSQMLPMAQMISPVGGMMPNDNMMQPSMDDYIRTADEVSPWLTWDFSQLPPWINFNDPMSFPE